MGQKVINSPSGRAWSQPAGFHRTHTPTHADTRHPSVRQPHQAPRGHAAAAAFQAQHVRPDLLGVGLLPATVVIFYFHFV